MNLRFRFRLTILSILICFIASCDNKQAPVNKASTPEATVSEEQATDEVEIDTNGDGEFSDEELTAFFNNLPPTAAGSPMQPFDEYRVVVSGTKQLLIPGGSGILNVWIGDESFQPAVNTDMDTAESDIAAVGSSALVTANAPDFEVTPNTSQCMLLHPTGVDATFNLTPKHEGAFKVGATVNLYLSDNCSGTPIPKAAKTLNVAVSVNKAELNEARKQDFINVFWEQLLAFWKAALALIFGLILFLMRKQIKAWFGYEQTPNDD